uniref:VWFA domain-containing protein n=1 Tax=Macrostomum lignano TaxID=282301 RepID=A0A1I8F5Z5_9PLAT
MATQRSRPSKPLFPGLSRLGTAFRLRAGRQPEDDDASWYEIFSQILLLAGRASACLSYMLLTIAAAAARCAAKHSPSPTALPPHLVLSLDSAPPSAAAHTQVMCQLLSGRCGLDVAVTLFGRKRRKEIAKRGSTAAAAGKLRLRRASDIKALAPWLDSTGEALRFFLRATCCTRDYPACRACAACGGGGPQSGPDYKTACGLQPGPALSSPMFGLDCDCSTLVVFNLSGHRRHKSSLKSLAQRFLGRDIQSDDAVASQLGEDALAR